MRFDSDSSHLSAKQPLRDILYQYVPKHMIERPKMGFGVPMTDWLRGPLKEWMLDTLATDRIMRDAFVNAVAVEQRIKEHMSGTRQWSESLWSLLMFNAWVDNNRTN